MEGSARVERKEGASFGGSRPLDAAEVRRFLEHEWWGVLCTASAEGPYAVPVVYGYDGARFYVISREGRKTRNLARNPSVCLTVTRVEGSGADWTSAVITGRAELVEGLRERAAALLAVRRQCGQARPVRRRDALRLAGAKVIRIEPAEITGRARDGGTGVPGEDASGPEGAPQREGPEGSR